MRWLNMAVEGSRQLSLPPEPVLQILGPRIQEWQERRRQEDTHNWVLWNFPLELISTKYLFFLLLTFLPSLLHPKVGHHETRGQRLPNQGLINCLCPTTCSATKPFSLLNTGGSIWAPFGYRMAVHEASSGYRPQSPLLTIPHWETAIHVHEGHKCFRIDVGSNQGLGRSGPHARTLSWLCPNLLNALAGLDLLGVSIMALP